jgi:hypothetical protein
MSHSSQVYCPYCIHPSDPEFDRWLLAHWSLDNGNSQDMTAAKQWYESEKRKFDQALAKRQEQEQRRSA